MTYKKNGIIKMEVFMNLIFPRTDVAPACDKIKAEKIHYY